MNNQLKMSIVLIAAIIACYPSLGFCKMEASRDVKLSHVTFTEASRSALNKIIISEFDYHNEPIISAFAKFKDKLNEHQGEAGQFNVSFDVNAISSAAYLKKKATLRLVNVPAEEALRCLAKVLQISISVDDRQIILQKGVEAAQDAAATEFAQFYSDWHKECEVMKRSSNTYDYIRLPSYRKIVTIGRSALPHLEQKMKEDKGLDFMLAFAVVEICNWNEQEFRGGSEQEFRDRVLRKLHRK